MFTTLECLGGSISVWSIVPESNMKSKIYLDFSPEIPGSNEGVIEIAHILTEAGMSPQVNTVPNNNGAYRIKLFHEGSVGREYLPNLIKFFPPTES